MHQPVDLDSAIAQVKKTSHINIRLLKPGMKIVARTENSLYDMTVIDPQNLVVRVRIPRYGEEVRDVWMCGATWGGSMIWEGRIGYDMHMELLVPGKSRLITSPVVAARIEGEGWLYEMDWSNR